MTEKLFGTVAVYAGGEEHTEKSILILSDANGYDDGSCRAFANHLIANGFHVVIPDLYHHVDQFQPENFMIKASEVLTTMKMTHGSSWITAIGFNTGAKVAALMGSQQDLVHAVVLVFPTINPDELITMMKPTMVIGGALDHGCPPVMIRENYKQIFQRKDIPYKYKILPGMTSNWSMAGEEAEEARVHAEKEIVTWVENSIRESKKSLQRCMKCKKYVGVGRMVEHLKKLCPVTIAESTKKFNPRPPHHGRKAY